MDNGDYPSNMEGVRLVGRLSGCPGGRGLPGLPHADYRERDVGVCGVDTRCGVVATDGTGYVSPRREVDRHAVVGDRVAV